MNDIVIFIIAFPTIIFFAYWAMKFLNKRIKKENKRLERCKHPIKEIDKTLIKKLNIYVFGLIFLFLLATASHDYFPEYSEYLFLLLWIFLTFYGLRLIVLSDKTKNENTKYFIKGVAGAFCFIGFFIFSIIIIGYIIAYFNGYL